jgi:putative transposase
MIDFKGSHFERDIILWGVRWYVAYPISYRQLEEMMSERGVEVDHSSLHRWCSSTRHCLIKPSGNVSAR